MRRKELLSSISGVFSIQKFFKVGVQPPDPQNLTMRIHVDEKKRIWGQFDLGLVSGYLLIDSLLLEHGLGYGEHIWFQSHGKDARTGRSERTGLARV